MGGVQSGQLVYQVLTFKEDSTEITRFKFYCMDGHCEVGGRHDQVDQKIVLGTDTSFLWKKQSPM